MRAASAVLWGACLLLPGASRAQEWEAEGAGAVTRSEGDDAAPTEAPQPRRLSDSAELDRAAAMYLAGDYASCAEHLGSLLDVGAERPFEDAFLRERARLYYSTCLLFSDERERAREPLRDALRENPLMSPPDSLTFPPPLVSLFLEVRDEMQQLIKREEDNQLNQLRAEAAEARRRAEERRKRLEELERLAAEETVVVENPRWLMNVPFGVGQFQNGNSGLGWTFLVSETLLAATALGSGLVLLDQYGQVARQDLDRPLRHDVLNRNTRAAYGTLMVSSWGLVAVAAAGILEAHLSYVPERKATRERVLPRHLQGATRETAALPRLAPVVDPSTGNFGMAIQGSF